MENLWAWKESSSVVLEEASVGEASSKILSSFFFSLFTEAKSPDASGKIQSEAGAGKKKLEEALTRQDE